MFLLAAELALFKRLTGYPLDSQGRPIIDVATNLPKNTSGIVHASLGGGRGPSWGVRIPAIKSPYAGKTGLTSFDPDAMRLYTEGFDPNAWKQVPVFDQNIEGRKYTDVWPCVTFAWADLIFDESTFIFDDPFITPDTTSSVVNITNRDGDVVQTGYEKATKRVHPDGWHMTMQVRVYAKSMVEFGLINAALVHLLPPRGALVVDLADGTSHACDLLLINSVNMSTYGDDVAMSLEPDEERFYCRAYNYRLETYYDNTTEAQDSLTANVITQRLIEIVDMRNGLLIEQEHDVNLDELSPIQ